MDTPEKTVLIANGIVRSEESKQLYCSICIGNTNSDNWQNHIETVSHVNNLQRFKWLFENHENKIQCKICKSTMNWDTLKIHAISHKIVPWYKPDDLHKIFFENHMLQWSNRLYCFPCDAVFLGWSAAFLHIDEENHKNRVEATLPKNKTLQLEGSGLSYKSLILNAVISWDSTNIACNICKCFGMGIENFGQHVEGFRHSSARFVLITNLKERINQLIANMKEPSDNPEKGNNNDEPIKNEIKKQPVNDSAYPTMFDDYIQQENATDFHCKICHCLINGRKTVEEHAAGKKHGNVLKKFRDNKISFMEGDDFYCEYCRCEISGINEVHQHVAGRNHKLSSSREMNSSGNKEFSNPPLEPKEKLISNSKTRSNESIINTTGPSENPVERKNNDEQSETEIKKQPVNGFAYPTMFDDYIQQENATDFDCKICHCLINGRETVEEHAAGKKHGNVLKKFRDNKISFMEGDDFYCEYCRCKIPGINEVHLHVTGRDHEISSSREINSSGNKEFSNPTLKSKKKLRLNLKEGMNQLIADMKEPSNNPEKGNNNDEPIKNEIKKQPVNGSAYPTMFDDYIQQENATDFHCKICHCLIIGRETVEVHTADKKHGNVLKKFRDNKISFMEGNDFYCEYCRCKIPGIDNVHQHVAGRNHKLSSSREINSSGNKEFSNPPLESKEKLISNSETRSNESIVNTTGPSENPVERKNNDEQSETEIKKQSVNGFAYPTMFDDYIQQENATDFHCKICHCLIIGRETVEEHAAGKKHGNVLKKFRDNKISFMEGNDFYCEYCRCKIPGINEVHLHVAGRDHEISSSREINSSGNKEFLNPTLKSKKKLRLNLKEGMNQLIADMKEPSNNPEKGNNNDEPIKNEIKKQPVNGSAYPTMFDDYIQQENATDFHCKICHCLIIGRETVEVHTADKKHGNVLKKFRDNKISFMEGNDFYCEYCRCKILGIDNVHQHVAGRNHKLSSSREINSSGNKEFSSPPLESKEKLISNSETRSNESIVNTTGPSENPVERKNNDEQSETEIKKQSVNGFAYPTMFDDYIQQENATDFHCKICHCLIIGRETVEEHAAGKKHGNVLKKFRDNKISFMEGNDFYCEYCRCKIPGINEVHLHVAGRDHEISSSREINSSGNKEFSNPTLKSKKKLRLNLKEGINHSIANMKEPSDNPEKGNNSDEPIKNEIKKQPVNGSAYPTMFDDYIQQENATDFHCKICHCLINGRETVGVHAARKKHENVLKKFRDNKISFMEGNNFYCEYCRCKIPGIDNVHQHVTGRNHKISSSRELNSSKNEEIPKDKEIANNLDNKKQSENMKVPNGESSPYDNVVISNSNAYCKICDCLIGCCKNSNIEEHIMGTRHFRASNLFDENKISFKKNDLYHCAYCDCSIFSNLTVRKHIQGYKHVQLSGKSKDSNETAKPTLTKLSSSYIVKLEDSANFFCRICNCRIFEGQRNIDEHVAGGGHAIASKKYGCDKISIRKGNEQHYCTSCDCTVSGIQSIWDHVKGERHKQSLNQSNGELTTRKNISDPTITGQTNFTRCNGFSNMPKKLIPRKHRNSRQRFVNLIWDQQIQELTNPVDCIVCDVEVENVVAVHSHLARHFNEDFGFSNIDTTNDENIDNVNSDKTTLVKSFNSSFESISTFVSDSEIFDDFESPKIILQQPKEPGRLERSPKKANMKRIIELLDFDDDQIYSMNDKLRELELGMKLSFVTELEKIYCLVCQKMISNTMDNYFKHLCSLDHIVYLERMERDDGLFEKFPEQFSSMDLGLEYMEEISENVVRCYICDEEMDNIDDALYNHSEKESHSQKCENMHATAMLNFEHIKLRFQCNWYKVQRYQCVPCQMIFRSEVNFVRHLNGKKHLNRMENRVNKKRRLIIDFCEACALLWYGYRRTYAYHCDIETHIWLARDGHYVSGELPEIAKELLTRPEEYINDTMKHYDEISGQEREKEKILIRDIEKAVKWKYPAKAFTFGSRVTGVGSTNSDIDVFLDCGDMYDGKEISEDKILPYMDGVTQCLSEDPESWVIEELLKTCRSPIIKVHHRPTGLSCDISFENGLAVENTALIKSFNDAFPSCRKMIIFLKRWMALCKLSGSERITSYALYWHVIFYLQKESIFPSVATLITMKNESHTIAGWEVGVARDFTYNKLENVFGIKELLIRFFTFWANFDYRYDVACPIIGEIVKKRTFANPQDLPNEMAPYINYLRTSKCQDPLRIDSTMCIQDPFDLQHNLTKAVNKIDVNRFRSYCSKSLDILL